MMQPLRAVACATGVILAVVAQVAFLPWLQLPGPTPDLVLVTVVGLAIAAGPGPGTVLGLLAGVVLDVAPPADHAIGSWAMCLCLVGYLAGLLTGPRRPRLAKYVVVAAAAALTPLGYLLGAAALGDPRARLADLPALLPGQVVYALLLAPAILPATAWLARGRSRKEVP
ncbi:rod shape-determining protein MreD [Kribbella sp. NPDC048915]|uniref:rod shape-determining protein MreD n=1 Tax=Kribbella sp. NPDC048915 TaxID=3155148 RepID=UPI0033ECB452